MVDTLTIKRVSKVVALRQDPTARPEEADILEYVQTGKTVKVIDDYLFYGYNDKPYIFVEYNGKRGHMLNEALEMIE